MILKKVNISIIFNLLAGGFFILSAQHIPYPVSSISADIKNGSHAVVRFERTTVNIISDEKMVVTQNKIITVFNKKGDRFGSFVYYYGKGDKLKDLNISIYDENGNLVEKIKQKRIQDLPADDGFSLYTDSRVKYFSYLSNTYPYTIKITYTSQTGNTAFIPSFIPVWSYNLGVENSSFTITHPVDIKLFTSIKKSEFYHLQSDIHKTRTVFTLTHARPLQKEPFSPPLYDIIPHVKFRLSKFHCWD